MMIFEFAKRIVVVVVVAVATALRDIAVDIARGIAWGATSLAVGLVIGTPLGLVATALWRCVSPLPPGFHIRDAVPVDVAVVGLTIAYAQGWSRPYVRRLLRPFGRAYLAAWRIVHAVVVNPVLGVFLFIVCGVLSLAGALVSGASVA